MSVFFHLGSFFFSFVLIWFCSGILMSVTDTISSRLGKGKFFTAFLLLGVLTSLSEMSVAVNSSLQQVPLVSVGNLFGASMVLFLFVAPLLAVIGNGVRLNHGFTPASLLASLSLFLVPIVFALDGRFDRIEGFILLLLYLLLLIFVYRQGLFSTSRISQKTFDRKFLLWNLCKVSVAALLVFFAGTNLVKQTVFFIDYLSLPASLFGLLVLSIGTNIPELTIAILSVLRREKDLAIGDYIGSAAFNVPILGVLIMVHGPLSFRLSEFLLPFIALIFGFSLFYVFARSKKNLSRQEGLILILFYCLFVFLQFWSQF